jgi:4-amino-4-deoxy-L-arabinose transferase-like glycosyltransferase
VHSYRGTAAARTEEGSGQRAATGAGEGNEPRAAVGRGSGERAAGQGNGERAAAAARLAAALLGLAVIGAYLAIALSRLSYPFTIEWLESNSLVEVHRILAGRPLYTAPAVGYVPDGYPPLYFAVSAAVARVLGPSYLALRLVSLASSLACFALLARLVQRETGSASAGIAAAGILAATYFVTGTWFDVGRVDSLFLALSAAALCAARWMRGTRGAVACGVLLAAAFLTKQNALAEGLAVLAALAAGPRRKLAGTAALTYGLLLAASTLLLGLTSHGWYVYYVFEQMGEQSLKDAALGQFWTVSLLPVLGFAVGAAVLGARRTPPELLAGCAALVVAGYAALVHGGGTVNDLLPAYLAVALLAGLAMGAKPGGLAAAGLDRLARERITVGRAGRAGPWVAAVASGLVVAQLAVLANGFRPAQAIPASPDRAIGVRLTAGVRALGGTVAVPADPGLALLAGRPAVAHQGAVADVLRATDRSAITSFTRSAARAVARRQFSAIIIELNTDLDGFPADLDRYYRRCPQMLLSGVPAAWFRPVTGARARPTWVWLPDGRGSCAAVARLLDGYAAVPATAQPRRPAPSGGAS